MTKRESLECGFGYSLACPLRMARPFNPCPRMEPPFPNEIWLDETGTSRWYKSISKNGGFCAVRSPYLPKCNAPAKDGAVAGCPGCDMFGLCMLHSLCPADRAKLRPDRTKKD